DRKDHGLLVDELLDAAENALAFLQIELVRLLLEERVDIGIAAVGVRAARDQEGLHARGRVAEDAAEPEDDVLELLLLIRFEESRALERAKPRLDADRLEIVENRLPIDGRPRVAPQVPGIETLRVSRLRKELTGLARIVGMKRWLPVEVEARRD